MRLLAAVAASLLLVGCVDVEKLKERDRARFRACEHVAGRDYDGCIDRERDRFYLFPSPTPLPEIEEE